MNIILYKYVYGNYFTDEYHRVYSANIAVCLSNSFASHRVCDEYQLPRRQSSVSINAGKRKLKRISHCT